MDAVTPRIVQFVCYIHIEQDIPIILLFQFFFFFFKVTLGGKKNLQHFSYSFRIGVKTILEFNCSQLGELVYKEKLRQWIAETEMVMDMGRGRGDSNS